VSAGVLWSGSTSESYNTSTTPTRWIFTNGSYSLTVGYESSGFISYYQLIVGSNIYECTIQTSEPTLPSPSDPDPTDPDPSDPDPSDPEPTKDDIASFPYIIFSIISLGTISVIIKSKFKIIK